MTMSYDTPVTYLTIKQYAEQLRISEKTVTRYLNAGELPGAYKDERGRWLIPSHVERTAQPAGEVLTLTSPRTSPTTDAQALERLRSDLAQPIPTMNDLVDELPSFVPIDVAAEVLEISRHAIVTHRDYFDVVHFGANGSLVVPRATIKKIRG